MNANRFFWDSHWLEIWNNNFCPSMGPNGGCVAMDSNLTPLTSAAAFFVASTPVVDAILLLHLLPRFVHPANFNQCHPR